MIEIVEITYLVVIYIYFSSNIVPLFISQINFLVYFFAKILWTETLIV